MTYRVIGCIPAGRKRYLELQVPHLLRARKLFSEIQIWLNTSEPDDVAYLHELAQNHAGYFRVLVPPQPPRGNATICQFWGGAVEPDAIYVRTDDDIVWMAHDALEKLVQYRLSHPEPFLVFGNIVNNAICSYLHQRQGCIPLSAGLLTHDATCRIGWRNPSFAEAAHRIFLKYLAQGKTDAYLFNRWVLTNYQRFGINVCSWFGRDFRPEDPELMKNEEEHWVTCVRPRQLGRPNEICGQSLFAHFAYYKQRSHMDRTDILDQYRRFIPSATKAS